MYKEHTMTCAVLNFYFYVYTTKPLPILPNVVGYTFLFCLKAFSFSPPTFIQNLYI